MRTLVLLVILLAACIVLALDTSSEYVGKYRVLKKYGDGPAAAAVLGSVVARTKRLLESSRGDARIERIAARWSGSVSELDLGGDTIAHSIGKRDVSLCIRDTGAGLSDVNTCMFVMIHELAHVATISVGHTDEFWANYKFLLERAETSGAYQHQEHPARLCGKNLGASPAECSVVKRSCAAEKFQGA